MSIGREESKLKGINSKGYIKRKLFLVKKKIKIFRLKEFIKC